MSESLPLLLVGGALGAGKTTLLGRWLAEPALANTAVLVNEPGDAPIDAHLMGALAGAARTLTAGCVCCDARSELPGALEALVHARRAAPRFERVIVELSGLAHPAPLLEDFASDERLRERFPLLGMVTLVDAGEGLAALDAAGARARVAAADVLIVGKTELAAPAELDALVAALARLNPHAEIVRGRPGAEAREVWAAAGASPGRELRRIEAALAAADDADASELETHTIRFDAPVELSGFCVRLAAWLAANEGSVLRAKGLVGVRGRHGPAVIQAVGASLQPVRTLKDWPRGAAPGALVVIGRGLDGARLRECLA
ncbi:MAG TPA: GTP-binding protein [Usitatibacter sp.]|nr:GTP-binding protein [Usitatibacter sp.]